MSSASRAINAYVNTEIDTAVPHADGHRLVSMLFDGALTAVADAKLKLSRGDIPGRGAAISKAIAIVEQGLRCSLDKDKGGEIASRLDSLYEYICGRLLTANIKAETTGLDEATNLLSELHDGWKGIGRTQPQMNAVAQEARV
jgi:flagellar protein FliS